MRRKKIIAAYKKLGIYEQVKDFIDKDGWVSKLELEANGIYVDDLFPEMLKHDLLLDDLKYLQVLENGYDCAPDSFRPLSLKETYYRFNFYYFSIMIIV